MSATIACRHCGALLPDCRCVRRLRAAEAFLHRPRWARGPLLRVWKATRRRAYKQAAGGAL